jgi:hypothetical protein
MGRLPCPSRAVTMVVALVAVLALIGVTAWLHSTIGPDVVNGVAPAAAAKLETAAGTPENPDSRHLLAYTEGNPVGAWDPDGKHTLTTSANTTWSDVAYYYYGSTTFAYALARANSSYTSYVVKAGARYVLPGRLTSGSTTRNHTVYRRDDPVLKADGLAFGSPYQGKPWRDGWAAWLPAVLSPLPVCSSSYCAYPTGHVALPAGSGAWQWLRGWQTTGATANTALAPLTYTLRGAVSMYVHGSLVTGWTVLALGGYVNNCLFDVNNPAYQLCAQRVKTSYSLVSGSSDTGRADSTTSAGLVEWARSMGTSAMSNRSLASPPADYGHFNVWVPRAWGVARTLKVAGSFEMTKYATPFSAGPIKLLYGSAAYYTSAWGSGH